MSKSGTTSPLDDNAPHILVVDDDRRIRELLHSFLSDNGFRVSTAGTANDARLRMNGLTYDLIVLDVMMPGETGMEFTTTLRENSDVPILMLTALSEPEDRISGLEVGVDDYLPKPFEPRELLLRITNILKHRDQPASIKEPEELVIGECLFNIKRGELKRSDVNIRLTSRERDLLRLFAANHGKALSRDDLAQHGSDGNTRSVDVQINRLRRKIETDPANPVYLQTVRGAGYILYTD